ncbi:MAG TPA: AAA family ATPase, partial [Fimbriimonas sp.]|nr:AAA family ATPase [Fimbriimonas sp.]
MIRSISVENIAIIEHAEVSFESGFSVLSGETGAGKSLLIDAIQLCLGERADTELVRTGCSKASAQMVVAANESTALRELLDEHGIEPDHGQLFISRDVFAEGRSVARINGRQVPVAILKSIGKLLVDLHGQHQHQALLDPDSHTEYLDSWIGAEAEQLKAQISNHYAHWSDAKAQLLSLRRGIREREQRLDMLRFQVKEIEEFGVQPNEEATLTGQINRLKNSEKLALLVRQATAALSEEEANARDLLATAAKAIGDIERLDETLSSSKINEALVLIEEA